MKPSRLSRVRPPLSQTRLSARLARGQPKSGSLLCDTLRSCLARRSKKGGTTGVEALVPVRAGAFCFWALQGLAGKTARYRFLGRGLRRFTQICVLIRVHLRLSASHIPAKERKSLFLETHPVLRRRDD